jgi:hypothetical protein
MDRITTITTPAATSVERVESLTVIELSPTEIVRLHNYLSRLEATCAKPCQRGASKPPSSDYEEGECYCFASLTAWTHNKF